MSSSQILPLYAPEETHTEDRRRPLVKYIRGSSSDKATRILRIRIAHAHVREVARAWTALRKSAASKRTRRKTRVVLQHIRADARWIKGLLRAP